MFRPNYFSFCALIILLFVACKPEEKRLFSLVRDSGIQFENNVEDGALDNSFLFRNFYNGGGVGIGDINNDGLPDVFMTSNMGENRLYLNKGNFKFEDISAKAGLKQDSMWSTGVVFVDVNNDGWLDIYVCNSGHMSTGHRRNQLYINNHNLTFTESAAKYGLDISAYSTQVTFFDYDNDGDLDCFMIDNSPIPVNTLNNSNRRDLPDAEWPVSPMLKGGGDHLFRNDNGHFHEVTREAGIHGSLISFGLGALVTDLNGDGWPDVYVSNDSYERDYLYINQGNGTFRDELESYIGHLSMSSMGTDMADINNDGYPDLFTTDMLPGDDYRLKTTGSFDDIDLFNEKIRQGFYNQFVKNCLQLNTQHEKFIEIGNYAGVSATDWSWGALMFDADNDGFNDIYVCNGVNRDVTDLDFLNFFANEVYQKMALSGKKSNIDELLKKIPRTPLLNKAYRNLGDLRFSDMGEAWGFTTPSFSNGAAYGDLDNDGDLDLIVNNENGPAFVYRNNSRELTHNHFVGVTLTGSEQNRFAIGSKIRLYIGDSIFYRELIPSRGFQSSVDYKQIIGLGNRTKVDSLVITWPGGASISFVRPTVDSVYRIAESLSGRRPAFITPTERRSPEPPILAFVDSGFDRHVEDDNVDFIYEWNLPKMLSREGPHADTADVNGDGFVDVYIGGTSAHPGQLYLQTRTGSFIKLVEPVFSQFSDFEDEAILFFDADGDGDADLFIGPGGNNNPPYSRQMQNRLFLNDGKGNFSLAPDAFPSTSAGVNTGVAVAGDFNQDGFIDLFIGGRSVPREYGVSPASAIFLNDGKGHFTDIAPSKNPDIAHLGMVTSACWTDLDGNGGRSLVVVGEWMYPHVYRFAGDHFVETKTNLDSMSGWWETISVADLNGDGRPDFVLGNLGENFYLHPSAAFPVKLWSYDFDRNGIKDKILSQHIGDRDMPVFLKRDMENELPILKKQNLKFSSYAQKSVQQLFPALADSCEIKTFNYCSSVIAWNQGNGTFRIQRLPTAVQLSSVNASLAIDVNGDGHLDLLLGGNEYGFLPQFGRLDGSFGHLLLGDGKGNFTLTDPSQSGILIDGQIRDIKCLTGPAGNRLLILRNDERPLLYRTAEKAASFKN